MQKVEKKIQKSPSLRFFLFASLAIFFYLHANLSFSDPKQLDKTRKFYKEHGMDFFGDLVSDEQSYLDDEKKHAKIELLADDARTKALSQLDALLKTTSGEMKAELLLRKAGLIQDRSRTAIYFENNPIKTSKLKSAKVYLNESISIYKQIERDYPGHPRMPVVIFSIAYNYGELRDGSMAFEYYSRLWR